MPTMKRGGRLRSDPEKQREWERRSRKRLPAKSEKRKLEDVERRKLKRALLIAAFGTAQPRHYGPVRQGCAGAVLVPEVECSSPFGSRPRFEMHEIVKRSRWPRGITVRSNVVLLCQAHHDWTEAEVREATVRGLLSSAPNVDPFDKFDDRPRGTE